MSRVASQVPGFGILVIERAHMDARPSRTAYRVALRRAVHQLADSPRVFEDPLATRIVGLAGMIRPEDDHRALRSFLVARSRYAEDELARSIQNGVSQYVLLGAGLDTFAYRNPYRGLRVFEVDHPSTQAWKRDRLNSAAIPIPGSLTFVPVDFETQITGDRLRESGFDAHAKTFFSWLGVTPYLTRTAFNSTLQLVAGMPHDSGIVFDFAIARASLDPAAQQALDALAARVAAAGEPFQLLFEPDALLAELHEIGFRNVEHLASAEINAKYFSDRSDGLGVAVGLAHLISAVV